MKKLIAAILIAYSFSAKANAENMITATLLDHVQTVTQFRSGQTDLALMDSIIQIGSYKGSSLFDLQAGFSGNTKPEPGQPQAANLLAGGLFKVSSLLRDKVNFPPHWEFLRTIQHGPSLLYDFREKEWFGSYTVGFEFDLAPKQ